MINMMEVIYLILATFRISKILTREDGPYGWFAFMRRELGQRATIQDKHQKTRETLAELVNCPHCIGVWVAGFLYIFRKPLKPIIAIFMIAGLQSFIQSIDDKLNGEY